MTGSAPVMMIKQTPYRLGTTAIAAVLTLSSHAGLAQIADPLSPAADTVAVETPGVSTMDMSQLVVETTPAPTIEATAPATEPKISSEPIVAKPVRPKAKAQPATRPAIADESASVVPAAPIEPSVAEPALAAETMSPEPAAAMPAPAVQPEADPFDADLPLMAGGAALAAFALLGTGVVASRHRRRRDGLAGESAQVERQSIPLPRERQAMNAKPIEERSAFAWGRPSPSSVRAESMLTQKLPNGFDISRFGRHVQAAYRGPTPDNPSLSLKRRLKRASFFDMKERQARGTGRIVGRSPELASA